jgi:predicted O-methyltransferase YrrM
MNSLNDPRVAACLGRLHDAAAKNVDWRRAADRDSDSLTRMGECYLAVSAAEGRLLYLLARGSGSKLTVEFGASFGVSTTYLAAAARDNGGKLVTTEAHPGKCAAVRATLAEAGLEGVTTLLEGDARETLVDADSGIDFVFLDGWKSMYLPVFELLRPKLADGALIAADNIDHEGARPYAEFVRASDALVSHTLGKMELSCYVSGS